MAAWRVISPHLYDVMMNDEAVTRHADRPSIHVSVYETMGRALSYTSEEIDV